MGRDRLVERQAPARRSLQEKRHRQRSARRQRRGEPRPERADPGDARSPGCVLADRRGGLSAPLLHLCWKGPGRDRPRSSRKTHGNGTQRQTRQTLRMTQLATPLRTRTWPAPETHRRSGTPRAGGTIPPGATHPTVRNFARSSRRQEDWGIALWEPGSRYALATKPVLLPVTRTSNVLSMFLLKAARRVKIKNRILREQKRTHHPSESPGLRQLWPKYQSSTSMPTSAQSAIAETGPRLP